jgi:hypothetical protein
MKIWTIAIIGLLCLLAACTATELAPPKVQPGTPPANANDLSGMATSIVDLPLPTTSIDTQIPASMDTPGIVIKTPTLTPPTPTSTFGPQEIAQQVLTEFTLDIEEKYSPDRGIGEWVRLITNPSERAVGKYNNQFYTFLTLHNGDMSYVLENKWQEMQIGYSVPDLLGWSIDNRYLYFYDSIIPDGPQPLGGFQQDLRRVDRNTGAIHPIPISWTGGMALSPDTTKVIYYDQQAIEVGVYDFDEGREQRIPFELPAGLDIWYAGDFTWSPNGRYALFLIQYGNPATSIDLSLRRVNLVSNKITTLQEGDISIVEWKGTNEVLITRDKIDYWLNPITGEVSLVSECPSDCVITQPQ